MERIASFTVDHNRLTEGVYVSRIDCYANECITTFDLRMKLPNTDDILSTTSAHTIEHLGATFLRNDPEFKEKVVYFGPMGCRTGFYVLLHGNYQPSDVSDLFLRMFSYIKDFNGTIPGQSATECGNYKDLNMDAARADAQQYHAVLMNLNENNTRYPE